MLFIFFFSCQLFSAVFLPIYTNLAWTCLVACDKKICGRFSKNSKTRSQRPKKTLKYRHFFHPSPYVFARGDETVKVFWKAFSAMISRALYLSENAIVTVQNRPVFSETWLNGASKRPNLTAILENVRVTAKVSIEC